MAAIGVGILLVHLALTAESSRHADASDMHARLCGAGQWHAGLANAAPIGTGISIAHDIAKRHRIMSDHDERAAFEKSPTPILSDVPPG
jgi:hypothetical protein